MVDWTDATGSKIEAWYITPEIPSKPDTDDGELHVASMPEGATPELLRRAFEEVHKLVKAGASQAEEQEPPGAELAPAGAYALNELTKPAHIDMAVFEPIMHCVDKATLAANDYQYWEGGCYQLPLPRCCDLGSQQAYNQSLNNTHHLSPCTRPQVILSHGGTASTSRPSRTRA